MAIFREVEYKKAKKEKSMLVGVIFCAEIEEILDELQQLKGRVDAAEIRLDYLSESAWDQLPLVKEKASLPLIFTFRKKEQGGKQDLSEEKRLKLFEKALSLKPAFADIEADTDPKFIDKIAKMYPGMQLIGSYHDFEKTLADLAGLLKKMEHAHFAMYKIVLHAKSTLDLLRLMTFARETAKKMPLCCISLGPYGQPSRVLGAVVGNVLNYTSLQGWGSSLYQYDLETLEKLYGFSRLGLDTKIYALIGDPVGESPGAVFHNEIFRKEGAHAVYVKLRLSASELEEFVALAKKLPFGGFSVTMPLKEAILPFLTEIDKAAQAIGAVNTVLTRGNEWIGSNTDGLGALHALELYGRVEGKKIALLGAGGSARAIAYEALKRGAEVMVFNRTSSRGEKLANDFGCRAYALDALSAHSYEILINTIPTKISGELPILASILPPHALVMDINHSSFLIQAAGERGCRCLPGKEMWVQQAELQQKVWASRV